MPFAVIAYDGVDPDAPARRLAARQAHLDLFERRLKEGTFLFGSALLDEEGRMIGSLVVADYPSREVLQAEWLDSEPYVVGDVWRSITIHPTRLPPCITEGKG